MAAEFLDANYDKVFAHYQRLLNSDNYVTRRQALKVYAPFYLLAFNMDRLSQFEEIARNMNLALAI